MNTIDAFTALQKPDQGKNAERESQSLGQAEFLKLMTTQLTHQDPFSPLDNGAFLGQIAQFGTVNGITELNQAFQTFAASMQTSQALEASSLLGRDVLVESDTGYLSGSEPLKGGLILDRDSNSVAVNIYSQVGEFLNRVELGEQQQGVVEFSWDGSTFNDKQSAPGYYRFEVEAIHGVQAEVKQPLVRANVNSLTLGGIGKELEIELQNLGQFRFSSIVKIL